MEYQGFITKQGGPENPKSKTAHSTPFFLKKILRWCGQLCSAGN
jgi:hypothetical protein